MKLGRRAGSGDVIDQRGSRSGVGGMPLALGGGGLSIGTLVVLVILIASQCLSSGSSGFNVGLPQFPGAVPQGGTTDVSDPNDDTGMFVQDVLADVQDTWTEIFSGSGQKYERAKLVLFTDSVNSGCGPASAATGPFYCPADRLVYLDVGFFDELHKRFGAPGDFAQAYVIAHEIGHHVQTLTGISDRVQSETQKKPSSANELSVRQELQADCYAGVWGHSAQQRGLLESGDLEEALVAAAAIGDDRIQQQSGGRVDQDTWTHGSSEQRQRWFKKGFDSGDPNTCNTFSGDI